MLWWEGSKWKYEDIERKSIREEIAMRKRNKIVETKQPALARL
jgi:hypothetical protein